MLHRCNVREWEWEGMGVDCTGTGGSGNVKSHSRASLVHTNFDFVRLYAAALTGRITGLARPSDRLSVRPSVPYGRTGY